MKLSRAQLTTVLQEAIDGARMDPEGEAEPIVAHILDKLGPQEEDGVDDLRKSAESRLLAAADQIDREGEPPGAASVNALVGVGLALLANGQDAEVFYGAYVAAAGV